MFLGRLEGLAGMRQATRMAKQRGRTGEGVPATGGEQSAPGSSSTTCGLDAGCAGVSLAVNSAVGLLYRKVGRRIRAEVLRSRRAAYGEEIHSTVSKELVAAYGNEFSVPNLSRMAWLAELFPGRDVVTALARELGWSHFV
jgi:hypothetical protein